MQQVIALRRTLEAFAALNPDMTLRAVRVFLTVAEEQDLTVTEIAQRLGWGATTTSRLLLDLSDRRRTLKGPGGSMEVPGLGVLQRQPSTHNYREVTYALTAKGRALLAKITMGKAGLPEDPSQRSPETP